MVPSLSSCICSFVATTTLHALTFTGPTGSCLALSHDLYWSSAASDMVCDTVPITQRHGWVQTRSVFQRGNLRMGTSSLYCTSLILQPRSAAKGMQVGDELAHARSRQSEGPRAQALLRSGLWSRPLRSARLGSGTSPRRRYCCLGCCLPRSCRFRLRDRLAVLSCNAGC